MSNWRFIVIFGVILAGGGSLNNAFGEGPYLQKHDSRNHLIHKGKFFKYGHKDNHKPGLIALYTFEEGKGKIVRDVSEFKKPWNLKIRSHRKVNWIPGGGLSIGKATAIHSIGNSRKISQALNQTRQLSLEVWLRPENAAASRKRSIVALREGKVKRVALAQKGEHYRALVQTHSVRWKPKKQAVEVEARWAVFEKLTHVVITMNDKGEVKYYQDGVLHQSLVDTLRGVFRMGRHLQLLLSGVHRGWKGDFFRVALYNKALTGAEIKENFRGGPYPDPDADGNGIPDVVDSLIAYDTASAFPAPKVFIPSVWQNVSEADQIVTYRSPFLVPHDTNAIHNVIITIPAGSVQSELNPVLTLLDSMDTRIPPLPLAANQNVFGYFQMFGELSPGASLTFPFSFDPGQFGNRDTTLRSADNFRLFRFNNSTGIWDTIPGKEDGLQTIFAILDKIDGIYAAIHADNIILVNNQIAASCSQDPARCGRGSWRNAVRSLREAFDIATPGDEIWVASDGTTPYLPTDGTGGNTDRATFLALPPNVGVYGGFDGTESTREQRNLRENPTIVSGNIGNTATNTDNSYNIFVGAEGSILDGFIVRDSYTDIDINQLGALCTPPFARCRWGGGLYVENLTQMTVKNCTFQNNVGLASNPTTGAFGSLGAGIYALKTPILIKDCRFIQNHSNADGPAITLDAGTGAQVINSIFADNSSDQFGGAVCTGSGSPVYQNCAFWNNVAEEAGGATYDFGNSPTNGLGASTTYLNCTFHGNRSLTAAGGAVASDPTNASVPTITNSILWNNTAAAGNNEIDGSFTVTYSIVEGGFSGTANLNVDPQFADAANPLGADGISGTLDDGLRLRGVLSPAYNSGTATQPFDLLNQQRYATANPGTGDAPCFTRFVAPSAFVFSSPLVPNPPDACGDLDPDRGAYAVTLSENPGAAMNGVDFLDHPEHRYGFDKIPHDFFYGFDGLPANPSDPRQVPDLIYFAMKKKPAPGDPLNTSEPVYLVVEDPTDLYVQSSDETVFTLENTDASSRINLTQNVTAITLTAQAPAGTHASALLEVLRDEPGTDPVLRSLQVEVYQPRIIDEVEITQVVRVDPSTPGSIFDYEIPTAQKFLNEARKGFQQAVIEIGTVTIHDPLESDYDENNNRRLDWFDNCCGIERTRYDALPYTWNNTANERIAFIDVGFSYTYRVTAQAAMGSSSLTLTRAPSLPYGAIEAFDVPNQPGTIIAGFTFTPGANPVNLVDATTGMPFALPQDVNVDDLFFSPIGGISTTPIVMRVARPVFQVLIHEILHHNLPGTSHVADVTNIMNGTNELATDLRFRPVPAADGGGQITSGSHMQWNDVQGR